MNFSIALAAASAALVLGGCTEQPQIHEGPNRKVDTTAWSTSEAANPAFYAPGWKANGDQAAWLKQINERTQGQNDYTPR